MIKIFADGANIDDMLKARDSGIVSGFTTNPTLMRKAGVTNYRKFAKEVLEEIPDMPISFEVFADELPEMAKEALEISSWGDNVYIKIPITNTEKVYTTPIIEMLSDESVKLNITAILTKIQVLEVLSALSKTTPSIVSIFAGRIADTGVDPYDIMKWSTRMCHNSLRNVEVLWASCREVLNIKQAEDCRCDIITVPNDILAKLSMLDKDLTELSLDTVKMFYNDAKGAGYSVWE